MPIEKSDLLQGTLDMSAKSAWTFCKFSRAHSIRPFTTWKSAAGGKRNGASLTHSLRGPWLGKALEEMPRSEILSHFENLYYARIPSGAGIGRRRQVIHWAKRAVVTPLKRLATTLRRRR